MYVRKKKNRSGSTSVVVVSKQTGRYKELHVVGVSCNPVHIEELYQQGLTWIKSRTNLPNIPDIFAQHAKEKFEQDNIESFFNHIENILLNGCQLILNQVFRLIGFDTIKDNEFRQLVISRILVLRTEYKYASH